MPSLALPELSVVVPSYNRVEQLKRCLESLERQDTPADSFDVVVVLDGSSDGTDSQLRALSHRFALTIVEQERAGTAAARNAGAARARGRLLLFIDDDEEADSGLVAAHLAAHRRREPILALGAIRHSAAPGADRIAALRAERVEAFSAGRAGRSLSYRDCFGGNLSLSREAFDALGGFAADLQRHNDTELGYRAQAAGLELVFVPEARVSECRAVPWRALLAEEEARGRLTVLLYDRHPQMIALLWLGSGGLPPEARLTAAFARLAVAARIPPVLFARVGLAIPARSWTNALSLAACYTAHWRGIRAVASQELWRAARSGVVILGYHAFSVEGEPASRYVVSARVFARQLRWLKRRGYSAISLGEYLDCRAGYRLPPPKTVVITVDDGYLDTATVARPLLERYGFRATLFLIAATPRGARAAPLAGRALIAPTEVSALLGETFEIGAHTLTHPNLTAIAPGEAEAEIAGSKQMLEQATGAPIVAFAYPYGKSDPVVRGLVRRAGFSAARGIRPGANLPTTEPYDLRYTEVRGTDSLLRFVAALARLVAPRG